MLNDAMLNVSPAPQSLMNTNKEDMRELAAQLYAVVVSTMSGNELKTAVQNLIKITKDNHVSSSYPQEYILIYFYGSCLQFHGFN